MCSSHGGTGMKRNICVSSGRSIIYGSKQKPAREKDSQIICTVFFLTFFRWLFYANFICAKISDMFIMDRFGCAPKTISHSNTCLRRVSKRVLIFFMWNFALFLLWNTWNCAQNNYGKGVARIRIQEWETPSTSCGSEWFFSVRKMGKIEFEYKARRRKKNATKQKGLCVINLAMVMNQNHFEYDSNSAECKTYRGWKKNRKECRR